MRVKENMLRSQRRPVTIIGNMVKHEMRIIKKMCDLLVVMRKNNVEKKYDSESKVCLD